ncbi:2-oxo-4-hydroxy-4-carboxy-5-ureidoimidazoline decarboxylase [Microplitis demolitor]|uniref:2-oxo-4-hydroxy-4-carboxy-5-ureidoimidazoline decarboxylase n=1 Tax=Microplitis demolitor TaxID=69319 RepID=UPI0004CC97C7|nr:2-oxo-4-hydroxy-4-carboxy-5-ureidoimidazoline decarboxylase [Microplitis demolitor]
MSKNKLNIEKINSLSKIEFNKIFENIIEHYPVASDVIAEKRPFADGSQLENLFFHFIDQLDTKEKKIILKKHPELTGEMYNKKILTAESENEQAIAGINQMTEEEKKLFNNLNGLYKKKFMYPFVICVREHTIASIISGIERRLENSLEVELDIAIGEVKKISKLRLRDLIDI